VVLFVSVLTRAVAQTSDTAREFWPAIDVHDQLLSDLRLLAFGGLKKGEEFPYQQWYIGAGLGYQWFRFTEPHLPNIDPDKENYLVTSAGYEYLRTIQDGKDSLENRVAVEVTPRYRAPAGFLLEDRNRVEFRWVNDVYSTRYRNRVTLERDSCIRGFRFTPYGSAEVFYDIEKGTWNREQYAGGLRIPYRRLLQIDVYYLRQNCPTCNPAHLNVAGLTFDFFVGEK
jgi:uncharacterized protein DUF2490